MSASRGQDDATNPYAPPRAALGGDPARERRALSAGKAFAIVAAGAVLFAALGGAIGFAIGRFAPGYYRVWFPDAIGPDFAPVELGLGLGLTQGFVGGIAVGLVIVLAMALSTRRRDGAVAE